MAFLIQKFKASSWSAFNPRRLFPSTTAAEVTFSNVTHSYGAIPRDIASGGHRQTTRVHLSFLRLGFSLVPTRVFPKGWFQAQQTAKLVSASGAGNPLLPRRLRPCFHLKF